MAAPSERNFFSFLGLPRKLRIDMPDLEQRYRALSRQVHPDYFYNATPAERRASLEKSSFLNDAYRTLKNPVARIEYLLKLEGFGSSGPPSAERDGAPSVERDGFSRAAPGPPPGLLEEVFALNEELDAIRDDRAAGAAPEALKARLDRAREPIEAKRVEHEADLERLSVEWDAVADQGNGERRTQVLTALRDRLLERNYISNLLAGIERELSQ